jgi:hypothetical protein
MIINTGHMPVCHSKIRKAVPVVEGNKGIKSGKKAA